MRIVSVLPMVEPLETVNVVPVGMTRMMLPLEIVSVTGFAGAASTVIV